MNYTEEKSTCVAQIDKKATLISGLQTLITDFTQTAEPAAKTFESIDKFYNSPMHSGDDVKIKQLYAGALSIASQKGFIPKMKPETVAMTANFATTASKACYKLAQGELNEDGVADVVADTATTAVVTTAKRICNPAVIAAGLNACVAAVAVVFPPASSLKVFVAPVAKFASTAIRTAITAVAPKVKSVIKSTIKTVVNTAKSVFKSVGRVFKKLFSFA